MRAWSCLNLLHRASIVTIYRLTNVDTADGQTQEGHLMACLSRMRRQAHKDHECEHRQASLPGVQARIRSSLSSNLDLKIMTQLTEYAVRVRGTQKYLPRSQRRDGRGGSHLEPIDFSDRSTWPERYARDMQIRSYTTERAAKNLLASWIQGKYYQSGGKDYDGEYWQETWMKPMPERRREDLEVVQITITLPEITDGTG